MIQCQQCGRTLEKVPNWLESVPVTFVCNNCPNQTVKGITEVELMPPTEGEAGAEPAPKKKKALKQG
ncbi:MAG: hypothetical protein KF812_04515 [Fimbriimonadaceae bacterium]|nr:hypothetical protein [Fimbriimonadaceae bacterium]